MLFLPATLPNVDRHGVGAVDRVVSILFAFFNAPQPDAMAVMKCLHRECEEAWLAISEATHEILKYLSNML